MMSFEEAMLKIPAGVRPVIFLGNGFSQSWRGNIFNYASLLEVANFGERDVQIKELFTRMKTWDFEAVMRTLLSAELVAEVNNLDVDIINTIKGDQQKLKDSLLVAISNNHPRLPSDLTVDQYLSVRRFLSQFSQIFTVNYDLLMYWARNQKLEPSWFTDDGFRKGNIWVENLKGQNVHFLHGGLHLYEINKIVVKHAYTGEAGGGIINQVRENLERKRPRFPLFVSEPTYTKKMAKIASSPYLSKSYRALKAVDRPIFILGHSMDTNDLHIFNAIKSSTARQIFVSVFGDEHSESNVKLRANAMAYLGGVGKTVSFYDAGSVGAWG